MTERLPRLLLCVASLIWLGGCPDARRADSDPQPPVQVPAPPRADGAPCDRHTDCAGICEGPGCGPGEGRCATDRVCSDDVVLFCGCEGVTFVGSSTCPGARFEHAGPCVTGPSTPGE